MKKFVLLIVFFSYAIHYSSAQTWHKAIMNEYLQTTAVPVGASVLQHDAKTLIPQLAGFPKAFPANPSFKNMRNLLLADVNEDGIEDIIFAADNKIYALSHNSQLWVKTLTGTAIYPPSAGDVDGDGHVDIVQVTGGSPANGRIYAFDRFGNVLSGWPLNFNNNWIICAPALCDLDNDGKMEIIVNERISPAGRMHILRHDGTSLSSNWPVILDGIPAVTPSVADVNNDGSPEIIVCSTKSIYIFDLVGQPLNGFPLLTAPAQSYSYQSPIVADFDGDSLPEIIGATHGDAPQYYVTDYTGAPYSGWPHAVPDANWTYSTPSVVKINGNWNIFMSRPTASDTLDMLYGWDKNGTMLPNFPIVKPGGLEGYISVADITGDNDYELIFGSNLKDNDGKGFIHAYKMDGTGELPGFPLKPQGFTFMNGVCIGDIDGNGKTNLVALSYSLNFGAEPDSVYINVYDLDVNYNKNKVLWGTYKGSNTRTGNTAEESVLGLSELPTHTTLSIFPNPVAEQIGIIGLPAGVKVIAAEAIAADGKQFLLLCNATSAPFNYNVSALRPGFWILRISTTTGVYHARFVKM